MENLIEVVKNFRWNTLAQMYGNAHASVIGFISTEWINSGENRFILDGAYSLKNTGKGRRNADLILCEDDKPVVVVEVESGISKYSEKIDSLKEYLCEKTRLEFGILIMLNGWQEKSGKGKLFGHNFENIVVNVKKNILLISIKKDKSKPIIKETKKRPHYNKENSEVVCRSCISGNKEYEEYNFYKAI